MAPTSLPPHPQVETLLSGEDDWHLPPCPPHLQVETLLSGEDDWHLPPCPPHPQVETLLSRVDDWQFDSFRLYEVTCGHPLSTLAFYLFHRADLIHTFKIDPAKLARWVWGGQLSKWGV